MLKTYILIIIMSSGVIKQTKVESKFMCESIKSEIDTLKPKNILSVKCIESEGES